MPIFSVAAIVLKQDDIYGTADLSLVHAFYPGTNEREAGAKCTMEIAQRMPDYTVMEMRVMVVPNG